MILYHYYYIFINLLIKFDSMKLCLLDADYVDEAINQ